MGEWAAASHRTDTAGSAATPELHGTRAATTGTFGDTSAVSRVRLRLPRLPAMPTGLLSPRWSIRGWAAGAGSLGGVSA